MDRNEEERRLLEEAGWEPDDGEGGAIWRHPEDGELVRAGEGRPAPEGRRGRGEQRLKPTRGGATAVLEALDIERGEAA